MFSGRYGESMGAVHPQKMQLARESSSMKAVGSKHGAAMPPVKQAQKIEQDKMIQKEEERMKAGNPLN